MLQNRLTKIASRDGAYKNGRNLSFAPSAFAIRCPDTIPTTIPSMLMTGPPLPPPSVSSVSVRDSSPLDREHAHSSELLNAIRKHH